MGLDGRQGIRRAGGIKLANRPIQRADHEAIQPQQPNQEPLHGVTLAQHAVRAERRSSARAGDVAAPGRARTTTSIGASTPEKASATRWRRRRLTRLRVTALPTAFDTTKPAREGGQVRGTTWTTSVRRPTRTPSRETRRKSTDDFSRDSAGSTKVPRGTQPARRTRPLRRRSARMARPARVRMRRRKPWVRLRRRLLGWKVRLLTRAPHNLWVKNYCAHRRHRRRQDSDLSTIRKACEGGQTRRDA